MSLAPAAPTEHQVESLASWLYYETMPVAAVQDALPWVRLPHAAKRQWREKAREYLEHGVCPKCGFRPRGPE
jgi:hypothetical protein